MTTVVAVDTATDAEWELLILEALQLGLTKEEIRDFLKSSIKS